jgi:hypothetical protein
MFSDDVCIGGAVEMCEVYKNKKNSMISNQNG